VTYSYVTSVKSVRELADFETKISCKVFWLYYVCRVSQILAYS